MVFIVPDPSGLAQGISTAGSALGGALMQRGMFKRQEQARERALEQQREDNIQFGSILKNTLGSLSEDATPLQRYQSTLEAVTQGVPAQMAFSANNLLQQASPLSPSSAPAPKMTKQQLVELGIDPNKAESYSNFYETLSTGGKTQFASMVIDNISRNLDGSGQIPGQVDAEIDAVIPKFDRAGEFIFPEVDVFQDRTPKERVSLKTTLLKENNEFLKDINKKHKVNKGVSLKLERLEQLNDSGKLPAGLGKINVDPNSGDLVIPTQANKETQLYVKTINDFLESIKESFGARITDFDIRAFMKRLPTLANSEDGRRIILKQMKNLTDLNLSETDSYKQVFNKYGVQNIDYSNVSKIAEDYRAPQEKQITDEFRNILNKSNEEDSIARLPKGRVAVRGPDGVISSIPAAQVELAKQKGYNVL